MGHSLFQLPHELVLTTLAQTFPCRESQIRALATLLHVIAPLPSPPPNPPALSSPREWT